MKTTKNYIVEGLLIKKGSNIHIVESADNISDEEIEMLEHTSTMVVYRSMQYIGGGITSSYEC